MWSLFSWGGRNGYGILSLICFSRTFAFISQVPDTPAVQPQAGVSSPPPRPICFLGKTVSFVVSSLENRKLLFIPQRLVFLLLSMAMELVKIQSSLSALKLRGFVCCWVCLSCVLWFWFWVLFVFFNFYCFGCLCGWFLYLFEFLFGCFLLGFFLVFFLWLSLFKTGLKFEKATICPGQKFL